jgi:hypothetical protein
MSTHIDQDIPATLIWLEEGAVATTQMFRARPADLTHGPDTWPHFDEAFRSAMHMPRSDEHLPWIRVGDRIIGPDDLRKMYVPSSDEEL